MTNNKMMRGIRTEQAVGMYMGEEDTCSETRRKVSRAGVEVYADLYCSKPLLRHNKYSKRS